MTPQFEAIAATLVAAAGTFLGSKVLPLIANAAATEMPEWMKWLLGPLGALIGMIVAVWWLSARLNKAEAKADKRDDERDADRKTLILTLEQNRVSLESNSNFTREATDVMREVRDHIRKVPHP